MTVLFPILLSLLHGLAAADRSNATFKVLSNASDMVYNVRSTYSPAATLVDTNAITTSIFPRASYSIISPMQNVTVTRQFYFDQFDQCHRNDVVDRNGQWFYLGEVLRTGLLG